MARGDRPGIAARLLILFRLAAHVLRGLFLAVALFPRWSERKRRAAIRRWSRRLLVLLRVRLRCVDLPKRLPGRCMLVLNHVSWVDVFLVDAVHPSVFVAKAEIAAWPLLGLLARRVGTVFIERGSRRAARRTNEHIAAALASGRPVACFPEGATSHGREVHRFHAALLQPAIDSAAIVQPVALRYLDRDGRISDACAYVGDESLAASLWKLLSHPPVVGELRFFAAVDASGRERRALAQSLHTQIRHAIGAGPARGHG